MDRPLWNTALDRKLEYRTTVSGTHDSPAWRSNHTKQSKVLKALVMFRDSTPCPRQHGGPGPGILSLHNYLDKLFSYLTRGEVPCVKLSGLGSLQLFMPLPGNEAWYSGIFIEACALATPCLVATGTVLYLVGVTDWPAAYRMQRETRQTTALRSKFATKTLINYH